MISVKCLVCQAPLAFPESRAGRAEECPTCRSSLTVPSPPRTPPGGDSPLARACAAIRQSQYRFPLERAVRRVRQSQWVDLAAYMTMLVLAMGLIRMTGTVAAVGADGRPDAVDPHFSPDVYRGLPTVAETAARLLAERSWCCLLPLVPSLLLFAGGFLGMVGRFRLAWYGFGSGAGRAFIGTALLDIGRAVCGLTAGLLVVWLVFKPDSGSDGGRGADILPGIAGLFILAAALAVFAEILSLPGLALLAWHQSSTDEHRHRIGLAAGFYPLLLAFLAVVVAVMALLPDFGVDLPREGVFVLISLLLIVLAVVPIIQSHVFIQAYRFPPAEDWLN